MPVFLLAGMLAVAGAAPGTGARDDPARLRAALGDVEAPWLRLTARTAMLALSPPTPDQARRLAAARMTLALWAPIVAGRAERLRRDLALAEQRRADEWLRPRLAAAGLTLRAPTRLLAACVTAAWRPPVDGPALRSPAVAALGRSGGLVLASAAGAAVRAPAGGQVSYAAPFRGYGRIVVIDHGHGWTSLLTGLARVEVKGGEAVAAGTVLGRAPTVAPLVGVELLHRGRPVDAAAMMAMCGT